MNRQISYVYFIMCNTLQSIFKPVKIGVSKNPLRRLSEIQANNPLELTLVQTIKTYDSFGLEKKIHRELFNKKIRHEWFLLREQDIDQIVQRFRQCT